MGPYLCKKFYTDKTIVKINEMEIEQEANYISFGKSQNVLKKVKISRRNGEVKRPIISRVLKSLRLAFQEILGPAFRDYTRDLLKRFTAALKSNTFTPLPLDLYPEW